MNEIATRPIHCCGCGGDVAARLTTGREVYPRRADLAGLPFWKCEACGNFVGCHHNSGDRARPLGDIATPAVKAARRRIHAAIDPLWQRGRHPKRSRDALYAEIARRLGLAEYHTGSVRSIDEADRVLAVVAKISGGDR